MNAKVYPLLGTKSKRLMHRRCYPLGAKAGEPYHYEPRRDLLLRLAAELNISEAAARKQLLEERKAILEDLYGRTFQWYEV